MTSIKRVASSLLAMGLVMASTVSFAKEIPAVNVYSYRQPYLIEPLFKAFTKETGIPVKFVYAKTGLTERLEREGRLSPADILLTTDAYRLVELSEKGLTQPVDSEVINRNIPSQYRDPDGHWYSLTQRVRNIFTTKRQPKPKNITYQDLANPKYKGKVCTRSGKDAYNVALVASYIAHHGETATKEWLKGFKANLARRPQGNDRDQIRAIGEGICDVSVGNNYYYARMLQNHTQQEWAETVYINFPNQQTTGAHVNVSGMVMTKYAPNKAGALKLMEFLTGDQAQSMYAKANNEYPINPNVPMSGIVTDWGPFKADSLSMVTLAKNYPLALKLLDEVKFDL